MWHHLAKPPLALSRMGQQLANDSSVGGNEGELRVMLSVDFLSAVQGVFLLKYNVWRM